MWTSKILEPCGCEGQAFQQLVMCGQQEHQRNARGCAGCFGRRVAVVTLQVVAEVGVPALGFEELRCFDVSAGAEGRVRVCSGGGC
eukprot:g18853.t1